MRTELDEQITYYLKCVHDDTNTTLYNCQTNNHIYFEVTKLLRNVKKMLFNTDKKSGLQTISNGINLINHCTPCVNITG